MVKEPQTKNGKLLRSVDRVKYIGISVIFAAVLAAVFDSTLRRLHEMGGNLPGAIEGVFSLLIPIVFAIIGVYLVVHVLHPNFGKRPMPASLRKVIENDEVAENMTRDELLEFVKNLASKDEEIKTYLNTVSVKADIATTLGISIVAFFAGIYGYMTSYTIGYEGTMNILPVSLCFMFIVFSTVYMILKTMNIVWDV
ncbi:MAG: hypothetical protein LBG63_03970 [Candidatus Methanoplasma sp.]|nr:hypothetical protein [Candidatus Methanoplasma sp.]